MRLSELTTLPIFEGLTQWGDARLRPEHRENVTYVELRRAGPEEEWKPLFAFIVLDGKIAFRLIAQKNERTLVYDPTTNTFSDVNRTAQVRDGASIRHGEAGQDDDSSKYNP